MSEFTVFDFIEKNKHTPYNVKHSDIIINDTIQLTVNYYTEPDNIIFNTKDDNYHIIEIKDTNNIPIYIDILKNIKYPPFNYYFDYKYIYEKTENENLKIFSIKNITDNIDVLYMRPKTGALLQLCVNDTTGMAYYDTEDFIEYFIQIKIKEDIKYNHCIKQHNDTTKRYPIY